MSIILDRFSKLAPAYRTLLCDVWGVVHNGLAAFPDACDVLVRFRAGGGTVVFITNAPRPGEVVMRQLARLGVPRESYDAIVSSGDVTRAVIARRPGQSVFHLGPERDRSIFAGLDVAFASVESADYVVCSGLFDDEIETPDDYRDMLAAMRTRALFMLCANPDAVVERGDKLIYCAGAIADAYREIGGEVLYAGKPYRPIYEEALARAAEARGGTEAPGPVLAIGDSVRTDLKGAASAGLDSLFVTTGIHAEELGGRDDPDPAVLDGILSAAGVRPKAVMRRLVW
ncbi:MAG TPA: TIGR01459 family HAD-type hydrolase [Xanthobacteraceae bacterium]|nr:TIGR01459 family HAD-type hydrolase [Xanthobacteraceae bacterium]